MSLSLFVLPLLATSLLEVAVAIVICGVALLVVNRYVPMDQKIKTILNVVVVIVLIVWLMKAFGAWEYLSSIKM